VIALSCVLIFLFWMLLPRSHEDTSAAIRVRTEIKTEDPIPPAPLPPTSFVLMHSLDVARDCTQLRWRFPNWNVLLIANTTSDNDRHGGCIYFDADVSDKFASTVFLHLDTPVFILASLYAIKHGAESLYIASNTSLDLHSPHVFPTYEHSSLLIQQSQPAFFNSHLYFGCSTNTSNQNSNNSDSGDGSSPVYKMCQHVPPLQAPIILPQQSTVCDTVSAPVSVDAGTYMSSEYSLIEALFMEDAYWALPVIQYSNFLEKVVWKMAIQNILWKTGQSMMLRYQKQIIANRDSLEISTLSAKLKADISATELKTTEVLAGWKCERHVSPHLDMCIHLLLQLLVKNKLLHPKTTQQINSWLYQYLGSVGYTFPKLKASIATCTEETHNYHAVTMNSKLYEKYDKTNYVPMSNAENARELIDVTCRDYEMPRHARLNFTHPWTQYASTLLVVTFNKPHYESIPYIDTMYRPFFPYILYCGPGHPDLKKTPNLKNWTYNFISYGKTPEGHFPGAFNYICFSLAVAMRLPVEGYLVIADDVFLATYKIERLKHHMVWYTPQKTIRIGDVRKLRECKLGMCDFFPRWNWWEDYQNEVISALLSLRKLSATSRLAHACHSQLTRRNGDVLRANGAISDVYYIPSHIAADFSEMVQHFHKHNVFLEIAIPTIIQCLVYEGDVEEIPGLLLWDETREMPWTYFTNNDFRLTYYMHPTKWGLLSAKREGFADFYCTKVLPFLHDPYGRITIRPGANDPKINAPKPEL